MKTFLLFVLSLTMPTVMTAQTVVWQMKPSDYSGMARICDDLYKVTKNGKFGLITSDGTIVSELVNENMSLFYEHKALLTFTDEHGECISGCLTDDGNFHDFRKRFYTLNGQKFFSDGVISVSDENGLLGYVDEKGNAICGFDGTYSRIKPFSEGYAAVLSKSKKRYVLINKNGEEMKFIYGGNGIGAAVGGCTNVYKGKAYVYDEYGEKEGNFYLYDISTKGALKKTSRVKDTTKDYLYCYSHVTGRTKTVPFVEHKYAGHIGLSPSQKNGLYGYSSGGNIILPYQLNSASQFENGLAIVEKGNQYGILKYIEGISFNVDAKTEKLRFYAGDVVKCAFSIDIPSVWSSKSIEVVVIGDDGAALPVNGSSGYYYFSVKPQNTSQRNFHLSVYGEGLTLYETSITFTFEKRERCSICHKDKAQCEYHGNHPTTSEKHNKVQEEKKCTTCGKKISECKYQGVH